MPGMMDTILNLGISRDAAVALAELTGAPAFVLDVTRRFQRCFAEIVLGADPDVIDDAVAGIADDPCLPFAETFQRYWRACDEAVRDQVDQTVPDEPWEQLEAAVTAVLRSWNSRRAVTYREHNHHAQTGVWFFSYLQSS
jgi:pyruvate,orthophosphate dikinase